MEVPIKKGQAPVTPRAKNPAPTAFDQGGFSKAPKHLPPHLVPSKIGITDPSAESGILLRSIPMALTGSIDVLEALSAEIFFGLCDSPSRRLAKLERLLQKTLEELETALAHSPGPKEGKQARALIQAYRRLLALAARGGLEPFRDLLPRVESESKKKKNGTPRWNKLVVAPEGKAAMQDKKGLWDKADRRLGSITELLSRFFGMAPKIAKIAEIAGVEPQAILSEAGRVFDHAPSQKEPKHPNPEIRNQQRLDSEEPEHEIQQSRIRCVGISRSHGLRALRSLADQADLGIKLTVNAQQPMTLNVQLKGLQRDLKGFLRSLRSADGLELA